MNNAVITAPHRIKSIRLISSEGFACLPEDGSDVEQHLTLKADGSYWLSRYTYDFQNSKLHLSCKVQGKMYEGKANGIFSLLKKYCSIQEPEPKLMDCGEWHMDVSFDDGTTENYTGSVCYRCNEYDILSEISQMIRTELDDFSLILFDGKPSYPVLPVQVFRKYLPLLYENTYLWNRFSDLCHIYFRDKSGRSEFFAFQRDPSCVETWLAFLDNMGGGVDLYFYMAAASIILCYKYSGNDIDAELAAINSKSK